MINIRRNMGQFVGWRTAERGWWGLDDRPLSRDQSAYRPLIERDTPEDHEPRNWDGWHIDDQREEYMPWSADHGTDVCVSLTTNGRNICLGPRGVGGEISVRGWGVVGTLAHIFELSGP